MNDLLRELIVTNNPTENLNLLEQLFLIKISGFNETSKNVTFTELKELVPDYDFNKKNYIYFEESKSMKLNIKVIKWVKEISLWTYSGSPYKYIISNFEDVAILYDISMNTGLIKEIKSYLSSKSLQSNNVIKYKLRKSIEEHTLG